MVEGNVTINASPKNAILGDIITFTGRVLLDGVPPSVTVGITIYLDTAPAPPTTIASGDTDSNGYYHIHWTSNYKGTLPIYAHAAAYQGFISPTIMVGIVTADVVVYLEPPLHNALLEFRYRSYGMDELLYSQLSVLGRTQWDQGTFTSYDLFEVRFPAQTVGGVSYGEASTGTFMYQNAPLVFTLILQGAIPTTLTISAPSAVQESTNFNISGILTRNDTGGPIPSSSITLAYNGVSLGSAITGVDGDYLKTVNIPTIGNYTLKASYGGAAGLIGSEANKKIATSLTEPINPLIMILGGIVVIGSILYIIKKRRSKNG